MKIGIFTNFTEFNPGYSLSGIVLDQVTMLNRYGNEVTVYVNENYNGEDFPFIKKTVPFGHLVDYRSEKDLKEEHLEFVDKLTTFIEQESVKYDFCFSHDWVFTGWNMPFALALQKAKCLPETRWLHWIHSIPSLFSDWWNLEKYSKHHRLVFPNKSDRRLVSDQFRCLEHRVEIIPHIKDLRTWMDFGGETKAFIDAFPNVMQADIVQILPVSVDRLQAKRVREVITIFSHFKRYKYTVCLVVANQWATQRAQKESVEQYLSFAKESGLVPMQEVIFTSEWQSPIYDTGIPRKMLRELMMLGNLFIFPTREESFGLVVPEASLTSGCLMVLNESSQQQIEISGNRATYFQFGSNRYPHVQFPNNNPVQYLENIALILISKLNRNEVIVSKTFNRQRYNMDNIYQRYYMPTMKGAYEWLK